jgi:hypothetical protein
MLPLEEKMSFANSPFATTFVTSCHIHELLCRIYLICHQGCFRFCSWCLWKALNEEGCMGLFHDVWTCGAKACGAKVLEYWMISSLKIKLNHSWKFWRNWIVSLVLLERSWWAGFNEIYLVRVAFRMWEILIFRVISASENSNKFQQTRFWKEKSVVNVVTLEGLPFNSSIISFHIWLFKKLIHTLQNTVRMLSLPIL